MNSLITIICIIFLSVNGISGEVTKIKGEKILISMDSSEFSKGDVAQVLNKNGEEIGKLKVTKTKGDKAIGRMIAGKAIKGGEVVSTGESEDSDQSSTFAASYNAVRGGAGLVNGLGLDKTPMMFWGDYIHKFDSNLIIKGGLGYWNYTTEASALGLVSTKLSLSTLDIGGGAGYNINLVKGLSLDLGGRLSYVSITGEATVSISFLGKTSTQTVAVSTSSFAVTPYIGLVFLPIENIGIAAEFRIPKYLSALDETTTVGVGNYLLLGGQFNF